MEKKLAATSFQFKIFVSTDLLVIQMCGRRHEAIDDDEAKQKKKKGENVNFLSVFTLTNIQSTHAQYKSLGCCNFLFYSLFGFFYLQL